MRILSRLTLLVLGAILIGCANPAGPSTPVETREWVVVDNNYQFYTNDTANYNYSYWNTFENSVASAIFTEMTGVAKKVSGAKNQGFGFLFCYKNSDNFYRILITTTGSYKLQLQFNNVWYTIRDWTSTSAIVQGFNQENTIQVTRAAGGVFTVSINDTPVRTFTDSNLTTDSFGPVATIGDEENEKFPTVPEDLRFRITAPTAKPSAATASYSDSPAMSRR